MSNRNYNLPTDIHEEIATSLVKDGGELFNELDAFDTELREAVFRHWLEREDTEYGNPLFMPTPDDLARIEALVAEATVTVHLPVLGDDEVTQRTIPLKWEDLA